MELENILLGLISMHQGATGYELNRIMRESTGYLMPAALSHIYPALRRLRDKGLVTYHQVPMKNRPSKKVYQITDAGIQRLQVWLQEPIESRISFQPFLLKMAFSPLMTKETILGHIDREIATLEAGDFFGETAFLSGSARTATVRVSGGPAEVLELDAASLRSLLEEHEEMADHLAEKMAARQLEGEELRDETGALISPAGLVNQFRRHLLKIIGR